MKTHAIVGMLIINSFSLGANLNSNSIVGVVCSLIGFGCFGILYLTEDKKKGENN